MAQEHDGYRLESHEQHEPLSLSGLEQRLSGKLPLLALLSSIGLSACNVLDSGIQAKRPPADSPQPVTSAFPERAIYPEVPASLPAITEAEPQAEAEPVMGDDPTVSEVSTGSHEPAESEARVTLPALSHLGAETYSPDQELLSLTVDYQPESVSQVDEEAFFDAFLAAYREKYGLPEAVSAWPEEEFDKATLGFEDYMIAWYERQRATMASEAIEAAYRQAKQELASNH